MEPVAEEETGLNLDIRRGRNGEEGLVMDWEWGLRKRKIRIRCCFKIICVGRWWDQELRQRIRMEQAWEWGRCPWFWSNSA